jgi:hypothetical protein
MSGVIGSESTMILQGLTIAQLMQEFKKELREVVRAELEAERAAREDKPLTRLEAASYMQLSPKSFDALRKKHNIKSVAKSGRPRFLKSDLMRIAKAET